MRFLVSSFLLLLWGCSSIPSRPDHYVEDKSFRPQSKKPIYIKLHPRVCFDEGHNNLAVEHGFYNATLGLLESDGYEIIRTKKRFTREFLKNCNVLYTSTVKGHPDENEKEAAESAFDAEEIESIVKWVREKGGSLLLVSDHGTYASSASLLLKQFYVFGSIGVVTEPKAAIPELNDPGIFTLQAKDLSEQSAIVLGRNFGERLKKVYFFRGQALRGPKNAEAFLKTPPQAKIGGSEGHPQVPVAKFPALGLAFKTGQGRVVVIGDGSVFASKIDDRNDEKVGINRAGSDNPQMVLNVFRWLSRALY